MTEKAWKLTTLKENHHSMARDLVAGMSEPVVASKHRVSLQMLRHYIRSECFQELLEDYRSSADDRVFNEQEALAEHAEDAVRTLSEIMKEGQKDSDRARCAETILERAFGKAVTPTVVTGDLNFSSSFVENLGQAVREAREFTEGEPEEDCEPPDLQSERSELPIDELPNDVSTGEVGSSGEVVDPPLVEEEGVENG